MFINYSAKGFKRFNIYAFIFFLIVWPLGYWLTNTPFDASFWFLYLFFEAGLGISYLLAIGKYAAMDPYIVQSEMIPLPESKNIKTIITEIERQKKWKVKEVGEGHYALETPVTWASFGEKINVIKQDQQLKIESTPKVPSTRFDYGKNSKNIKEIVQIIKGQT